MNDKDIKNTNWSFKLDQVCSYAYQENLFSKEECELIIKIGNKNKLKDGEVGLGKHKTTKNLKIRDSKICWLYPDNDTSWIYRKLTDCVINLNNKFFNFDITSFSEGLQFTHYKAPSGHYSAHVDKALNTGIRKLSIVVQLTDPSKYKGGNLNLIEGDEPFTLMKGQGTLLLFPSYTLHQVTPITKGERNSLVAWITGPNFK